LSGQQAVITFDNPPVLSTAGPTTLTIFVDVPDDDLSNDSFSFVTLVKPAPGGGKFVPSAAPTYAVYQKGKPFDVTVVDQPVVYDIVAPRIYTNNDYNQNPGWVASVWATTASGASVSGASFVAPNGSTDLEYTFETSDVSLEDSIVTIYYKVTDNANGCDTVIKRDVLIYPTIVADFEYQTRICDGDAV
jgi:hypothetical protein